MRRFRAALRRFAADQGGATAIEYGLIAALVAVGAIASMALFGGSLTGMFDTVASKSSTAMDNART